MSANIVEALFVHIERVPFDVLKYLDDENEDWLPRLKGVQPERFVHEIRRALGASPDLQQVAWLYCWLLSRQRICPWLLVRFVPTTMQVDYYKLFTDCATALHTLTGQQWIVRARKISITYYACIVNSDLDPQCLKSGVMFLVLWEGLRFAAAYAETNVELQSLTTALQFALRGKSVELMLGQYGDLDSVIWAGRHDCGGRFLLRSDPSHLSQMFWRFDDEPEGVADQGSPAQTQIEAPTQEVQLTVLPLDYICN